MWILLIPEHCTVYYIIGDIVLDVEAAASNLAEGSLNALPGLSLLILVFICIFPAWLMGACDFCLGCSSFLGDKYFSLSLTGFGGQIGAVLLEIFRFFKSGLYLSNSLCIFFS